MAISNNLKPHPH